MFYDPIMLTDQEIKVWELRVRLLEMAERTLRAMGKEIKGPTDLQAMSLIISGMVTNLLDKNATHFERELDKLAKEMF